MARPRQTSDSEILGAAQAEFMRHGNRATTAAIAERAGISEAGLLKRFETKDNLLVCAMSQFVHRHAAFPALPTAPVTQESLVQFAAGVLNFFRQIIPIAVMVHSHLSEQTRGSAFGGVTPVPLQFRAKVSESLAAAVERGDIHVENPTALAAALTGTLWQAAFFEHAFGDQMLAGAAEGVFLQQLIATLWHGVSPTARRAPASKRPSASTPPASAAPSSVRASSSAPARARSSSAVATSAAAQSAEPAQARSLLSESTAAHKRQSKRAASKVAALKQRKAPRTSKH